MGINMLRIHFRKILAMSLMLLSAAFYSPIFAFHFGVLSETKVQEFERNVPLVRHVKNTPGPNIALKPVIVPSKGNRGKSTSVSSKVTAATTFTCATVALSSGQVCVNFQFGWGKFDSSDPAPGNRVMLVRYLNSSTETLWDGLDFYNSAGENIRVSILVDGSDQPDSGFGIGPDPNSPHFAFQLRLASMNGAVFNGFVIFTYPTTQPQIATWIHPRLLGDTLNNQQSPFVLAKPVSFISANTPVAGKQGEVQYPWTTTDAGRMQITVNHSGSQASSLHVIATFESSPVHGGDFTVQINPGSNIIYLEDHIATRLDPGLSMTVRLLGNDTISLCQTFPNTTLVQINVPPVVVALPPPVKQPEPPRNGTRPPQKPVAIRRK